MPGGLVFFFCRFSTAKNAQATPDGGAGKNIEAHTWWVARLYARAASSSAASLRAASSSLWPLVTTAPISISAMSPMPKNVYSAMSPVYLGWDGVGEEDKPRQNREKEGALLATIYGVGHKKRGGGGLLRRTGSLNTLSM